MGQSQGVDNTLGNPAVSVTQLPGVEFSVGVIFRFGGQGEVEVKFHTGYLALGVRSASG